MQCDCALRIAGRWRLTSLSVEYKAGNQSLFECAESFTKEELRQTCHYAVFEDKGVGTSGSERCHLHDDQAQDALDRPVVKNTATSDDNIVLVWRPLGQRLNPAFVLKSHCDPTASVMVWVIIVYNTLSLLVLIRGTMTVQWYVHDILQQHVLPLMQRIPEAIFQQDNARPHTARMSQELSFLGLPDSRICLQSSISGIIWDGKLGIPRV
ncbi:transposable element Tcb2 transposase [Trichonephila clavipes]|nr:transposable element Tcb2 transposase [Trichonephila clavipes]